jgi:hypothetical protein
MGRTNYLFCFYRTRTSQKAKQFGGTQTAKLSHEPPNQNQGDTQTDTCGYTARLQGDLIRLYFFPRNKEIRLK